MKERARVKVYGERNSGTRYVTELFQRNLDAELLPGSVPRVVRMLFGRHEGPRDLYFRWTYRQTLGWKHAVAPSQKQLNHLNLDGIVFVTLTKNPYAWLLSMYRRPYHQQSDADSFSSFLQSPWTTVGRENYSGAFLNPITMWNEKNRSYLSLNGFVRVCNLRYEDLLQDPDAVLRELADKFSIPRKKSSFENVTWSTKPDKGKSFSDYQKYYLEEHWREKLDPAVLPLIHAHLDQELMGRFRYEVIC